MGRASSSPSARVRPTAAGLLGWEGDSASATAAGGGGARKGVPAASASPPCCAGRARPANACGKAQATADGWGAAKAKAAAPTSRGGPASNSSCNSSAGGARWRSLLGRRAARPSPPSSFSSSSDPTPAYLALHRPLALLALIPTPAVLFAAGATAGAIGKTLTAPLDRVKLLLQTRGGLEVGALAAAARSGGVGAAFLEIGRSEGVAGYWRGNVPQILKVIPYSATQLCAYEALKRAFAGPDGRLSLGARLGAGAAAGMAATLATHPLDTLRLRMAVDPSAPTIAAAARAVMAGGGGPQALYRGLGASLASIAPYMAIELAAFDVLGAAVAEGQASRAAAAAASPSGDAASAPPPRAGPAAILINGFGRGATAALIATAVCYPLDTARRRIQLAGAGALGGEGLAGLVRRVAAQEGPGALYRGFWPNAAKNLPNKGVKLGTFDAAKRLLGRAQAALEEERAKARAGKGAGAVAVLG